MYPIVLLAAGCAPMADRPGDWVTSDGRTLADSLDFDDCLHKAQYPEMFVSETTVPSPSSLPQTDRTLLDICMQAHGYQRWRHGIRAP
jgi:hypothetical protein